ncbi:MAG TPA: serine hydrolase [Gemmatimonas sp.]|nr:serine hydrolase [Gemmatimonas sp.]
MFKPALCVGAAVMALASPAIAQDKTADVDRIFSFATATTPGCAVGVSRRGETLVNRAYGLADVPRNVPIGKQTLFDIGSTQKQFTAAAMLRLVEEGRVSLSDDVRKYLPELPDYGHKITIDHLLTHTSGVRDWTAILPLAEPGTPVVKLIMRQQGLNFVPGDAWSYSSSGFELAKEIVARVSGMSFADAARRRLFEPLGMTATAYVPDIQQAGANAAVGYQKNGAEWTPFMRLGTNRGGGAIVSNIGDLLLWNEALGSGKLGAFVTRSLHQQTRLNNGRTLQYARGLQIDSTPGGTVISHSGGAAGFSTWMGRVPAEGVSVAVACNFDPVSATALAARVADLFLPPVPKAAQAAAMADAAGIAGIDVTGRAGLYIGEGVGDPLRLTAVDGKLRFVNGPALVTVAQNQFRVARADLFFRSQDKFTLRFPFPDQLEITSMEGKVSRYRRAQPWTPAAADLQAFDGRYENQEVGAVAEILPGQGSIVMRLERDPQRPLELTPAERDTYTRSLVLVRFRRDAAGKVTGFEYVNPLLRGLVFTRVGNRVAGAASSAPTAGTPPSAVSGMPPTPLTASPSSTAAPKLAPALETLTGEYEMGPGRTLSITVDGGVLQGEATGSSAKVTLKHVSGTTFSAIGRPTTLEFTLDSAGRATALVMRENGNERTLRKLK